MLISAHGSAGDLVSLRRMGCEESVWKVLGRCLVPLYFPVAAMMLGVGILLPVLPLYLKDEGVSLSLVGLIIAGAGLGSAMVGLPAAAIAERFGNDRMMFMGILISAITILIFPLTSIAIVLFGLRVVGGFGVGSMAQSRNLFIARNVEVRYRGRVASFMGGTHRLTFVIGPVLGGTIADQWGYAAAFTVAGLVTAVALLWIVLPGGSESNHAKPPPPVSVRPALRKYRRLLLTGGVGTFLIMAAREGRYVVVPLVADQFDLSSAEIGLLVSVGTAIDFAFFPIAGWIMDRFGRLYAVVPFFSLMAVGLILLGRSNSTSDVIVASIVMGVGNGLTSGSMLTLASDLAPADAQGPFIAGINLMSSGGLFAGPFLVGWLADISGINVSAYGLATILFAGVAWMAFVVGESSGGGAQRRLAPKRTTAT